MKAALLIFLLFVGFNIARYLVNLVKLESKGVKTYRLSATRQFFLLFYALFCFIAGSSLLYTAFTLTIRVEAQVVLFGASGLLLLLFVLTFWLHVQYAAYQAQSTIRFDPADLELTLLSAGGRVRIRRSELARVQWVRCAWPKITWGDYEYLVLHLHNGSRLLLTSLLLPLPDLFPLFAGKEVRVEKRIFPRIKKNF